MSQIQRLLEHHRNVKQKDARYNPLLGVSYHRVDDDQKQERLSRVLWRNQCLQKR